MSKVVEEKLWHVIYTKSRWEKKVDTLLLQKGIESWCPVQKKERFWTDRKKIIDEPLFRSYVFVRIPIQQRNEILSTNGVVNFLYFEKKPAIIRDQEIELIKKYLGESYESIEVVDINHLPPETKVTINQGVFMGKRGEVVKSDKRHVFVKLESINMMMIVEFKKEEISLH